MTKRTFIFYPEWLDYINKMNDAKDRLDLYNIIASYGCCGEYSTDNAAMEQIFDAFIKTKIDIAQNNYQEKVNAGKTFGRKKVIDDNQIKMFAAQGMRAKEIASTLGISEAAVYHSEGWRSRK